jgi:hypothetical protein
MEENMRKSETEIKKTVDNIHKEIQPALYEFNPKSKPLYEEYEKTLMEYNEKILKVTDRIRDERPELVKYLEEMTVTIPDENHPEVSIKNLQEYYESLIALLDKYILEHPDHAA